MNVLWDESPLSLQEVHARLKLDPPVAYTTVQTILNVLHRKGHVTRKMEGRRYSYLPTTSRARAFSQTVRDVIGQLFGGSTEAFIVALIEENHVDPSVVASLARRVAQEKKKRRGK